MLKLLARLYSILSKNFADLSTKATALCISKEIRSKKLTLLNIGSGDWECPGWICLDYPSEWYRKAQKKHKIIPYDIRSDLIPFEDNSVDVIYCSHVVEHIENHNIQKFFEEVYRVLKVGGVFRICCPDAEFLYKVAKTGELDYWHWRNCWFSSKFWDRKDSVRPIDYLVREVATPKLMGYINSISDHDVSDEFENMSMNDFLNYLTEDLSFRKESVGDHINYWTFDKMNCMLQKAGFDYIIRSKWNGSLSKYMHNLGYFDTTHPQMSLYVETIKQDK